MHNYLKNKKNVVYNEILLLNIIIKTILKKFLLQILIV